MPARAEPASTATIPTVNLNSQDHGERKHRASGNPPQPGNVGEGSGAYRINRCAMRCRQEGIDAIVARRESRRVCTTLGLDAPQRCHRVCIENVDHARVTDRDIYL